MTVEAKGDGEHWNINTAGIFKTSYGAKREVVYNRHTTAKQPAEATEESLSEEQGGTTTPTRMNSTTQPTAVSGGKGSESVENGQERGRNINEDSQKN